MTTTIDHSGKRFGRLTVVRYAGFSLMNDGNKNHKWVCRCDCGAEKILYIRSLQSKGTQSCGCLKLERISESKFKHGAANSKSPLHKLYWIWGSMKDRCRNPKNANYKNYGKRGIGYDKKWEDFINFKRDMAPKWKPGLELDRRNNYRNYCKGNCRWVTRTVNQNNKRNNSIIVFRGLRLTKSQWSEKMKIPFNAFGNRERLGWSYEKILTTPIRRFSKKRKTPFMKFNGKKQSILIWSRETGIKYSTIYGRFMKRLKPREILAEIDARSALEGKS